MQELTLGAVHAMAWMLKKDSELKRLRGELGKVEAALVATAKTIPEQVRDIDTIEALVLGYLDDDGHASPSEIRTEIRTAIAAFKEQYQAIADYAKLFRRKIALEALIDARKEVLLARTSN